MNTQTTLPTPTIDRTENDAVIELATTLAAPHTLTLHRGTHEEASVLLAPKGMAVHAVKPLLDPYLPRPERRVGTTNLTSPASFIAWVKRAKNPDSAIYVDDTSPRPSLVAIIDHDERGPDGSATARWGQHRAFYAPEVSEPWAAWTKAHSVALDQRAFAEFIEERALDLLDEQSVGEHPALEVARRLGLKLATAGEVIAASRGLKIRAEVNVGEAVTLASGEVEMTYTETHKGFDGAALTVPSAFMIGVPVFKGAPRDVLLVRLRYRRVPGQPRLMWVVSLHNRDDVQRSALEDLMSEVETETGLDVFRGVPTGPR